MTTSINLSSPNSFDELVHKFKLESVALDAGIDIKSQTSLNLDKFITLTPALLEIKDRVLKLAPSNIPILIIGESGTGKELIALALHGERDIKKFIAVNCGAIPSELLEAEFFGSVKGAYTGSIANKDGLISQANGGTLFLDELGDMQYTLQCKLLRVLQTGRYRPVGSVVELVADFRLISATNRIDPAIYESGINHNNKQLFRPDLYYRIAGHIIKLPPLRERLVEDRALICRLKSKTPNHAEVIFNKVKDLPLFGNVRELLNKIEENNILL